MFDGSDDQNSSTLHVLRGNLVTLLFESLHLDLFVAMRTLLQYPRFLKYLSTFGGSEGLMQPKSLFLSNKNELYYGGPAKFGKRKVVLA